MNAHCDMAGGGPTRRRPTPLRCAVIFVLPLVLPVIVPFVLLAALPLPAAAASASQPAPAAAEDGAAWQALLAAVRYQEDPGDGLVFHDRRRGPREIVFVLGDAASPRLGVLRLQPRGYRGRAIRSFSVQLSLPQARPRYDRPQGARDEAEKF